MPIYEYQCSKCGHQLEAFQSISEAPLTECPNCNSQGLSKLISNTSFQLKGSGWYKTDYEKKVKPSTETKTNETAPADVASKDANVTTKNSDEQTKTTTTDKKTDTKAG